MDDDPRAQILTDQEAHLGLQSWMIISTRTLARVATILGKAEDAVAYKLRQTKIEANLNANFWDESRQLYDDWYLDETGNKQFVGHTGYLNFFPFFLNVIPQEYNERFMSTFEKLIDPATGLWSEFGVRSLSIYDPCYRLGDDYWIKPNLDEHQLLDLAFSPPIRDISHRRSHLKGANHKCSYPAPNEPGQHDCLPVREHWLHLGSL